MRELGQMLPERLETIARRWSPACGDICNAMSETGFGVSRILAMPRPTQRSEALYSNLLLFPPDYTKRIHAHRLQATLHTA